MKQIPLRVINEKVPDFTKPVRFSYVETMLGALRSGGVQGLTIEDMEKRFSAIDKLDAAKKDDAEYVLLEEADYKTLLSVVTTYRFRMFLHAAIKMKGEVEHAATVDVEVKN